MAAKPGEAGAGSTLEATGSGAPTSAFGPAGTGPLSAGAGRVSRAPRCKGAPCRLSPVSERESLEGLGAWSFCGLAKPAVGGAESSCVGRSGARSMRARLATAAAPASASPAAVSFQRRELRLAGFRRLVGRPIGRSLPLSICSRQLSRPAELGLDGVDAAGGGRGAGVDDSSARFNSASISSAFTCRFGAPCMARSPSIPLTPERALPPVASRRSFAIESGTRPLIAARAACPQAPARQPEGKALYSERCWWTCRWRAAGLFRHAPGL